MTVPPPPPTGQLCAIRNSARHTGLQEPTFALHLERSFTPAEYESLKLGLLPQQMEDHWFVYFDGVRNQLVFHRSWTNFCIFIAVLAELPDGGCQLSQAWANANPDQFRCLDPAKAAQLLSGCIDMLLRPRGYAPPYTPH